MVVHNSVLDPYSPDGGYFECTDCGTRTNTDERLSSCPDCGGEVQNLAVPRE